jgi:hypothetical protein
VRQRAADPSVQRRPVAVRVLSGVPRASRSEIPDARSQVASDGHDTDVRANELVHGRTFDPAGELSLVGGGTSEHERRQFPGVRVATATRERRVQSVKTVSLRN